ncbi:MAG: hypothetical protein PHD43_07690, partial [Methylococcales bacterium]|nr:hypothetical protein [Methylococcales bacterium]
MKTGFGKNYLSLVLLTVMLPMAKGNAAPPITKLVSVNSVGTASGNGVSISPKVSANGRFVAFSSDASDMAVTNDTNGTHDLVVRDLKTGTMTLANVNNAGTTSGGDIIGFLFRPVLSADGRFVAFVTDASDLVANDTNGSWDIFVRDLKKGTTTLASVNRAGTASGNDSTLTFPELSPNGRFVAFSSYASDLVVANDTNGRQDVFVRDLMTGTTTLVSVNSAGTSSGNSVSDHPKLSANGRFVAFSSYASDLVANDTNDRWDSFVRDLKTGTTTLASVNSAGTASDNGQPYQLEMSANGRFVAFDSDASDLVANDTNDRRDSFVRDLKKGTTTLASVNSAGTASGTREADQPQLSPNGRFVVFKSYASDLVANDTNGRVDIFVRDLKT